MSLVLRQPFDPPARPTLCCTLPECPSDTPHTMQAVPFSSSMQSTPTKAVALTSYTLSSTLAQPLSQTTSHSISTPSTIEYIRCGPHSSVLYCLIQKVVRRDEPVSRAQTTTLRTISCSRSKARYSSVLVERRNILTLSLSASYDRRLLAEAHAT